MQNIFRSIAKVFLLIVALWLLPQTALGFGGVDSTLKNNFDGFNVGGGQMVDSAINTASTNKTLMSSGCVAIPSSGARGVTVSFTNPLKDAKGNTLKAANLWYTCQPGATFWNNTEGFLTYYNDGSYSGQIGSCQQIGTASSLTFYWSIPSNFAGQVCKLWIAFSSSATCASQPSDVANIYSKPFRICGAPVVSNKSYTYSMGSCNTVTGKVDNVVVCGYVADSGNGGSISSCKIVLGGVTYTGTYDSVAKDCCTNKINGLAKASTYKFKTYVTNSSGTEGSASSDGYITTVSDCSAVTKSVKVSAPVVSNVNQTSAHFEADAWIEDSSGNKSALTNDYSGLFRVIGGGKTFDFDSTKKSGTSYTYQSDGTNLVSGTSYEVYFVVKEISTGKVTLSSAGKFNTPQAAAPSISIVIIGTPTCGTYPNCRYSAQFKITLKNGSGQPISGYVTVTNPDGSSTEVKTMSDGTATVDVNNLADLTKTYTIKATYGTAQTQATVDPTSVCANCKGTPPSDVYYSCYNYADGNGQYCDKIELANCAGRVCYKNDSSCASVCKARTQTSYKLSSFGLDTPNPTCTNSKVTANLFAVVRNNLDALASGVRVKFSLTSPAWTKTVYSLSDGTAPVTISDLSHPGTYTIKAELPDYPNASSLSKTIYTSDYCKTATCDKDGICDSAETVSNCPSDCTKYYKCNTTNYTCPEITNSAEKLSCYYNNNCATSQTTCLQTCKQQVKLSSLLYSTLLSKDATNCLRVKASITVRCNTADSDGGCKGVRVSYDVPSEWAKIVQVYSPTQKRGDFETDTYLGDMKYWETRTISFDVEYYKSGTYSYFGIPSHVDSASQGADITGKEQISQSGDYRGPIVISCQQTPPQNKGVISGLKISGYSCNQTTGDLLVKEMSAYYTENNAAASGKTINFKSVDPFSNIANAPTDYYGKATVYPTVTYKYGTSIKLRAELSTDSTVYQEVTITPANYGCKPSAPAKGVISNLTVADYYCNPTNGDLTVRQMSATYNENNSPVSNKNITFKSVDPFSNIANAYTDGYGKATIFPSVTYKYGGSFKLRAELTADSTIYQDTTIAPSNFGCKVPDTSKDFEYELLTFPVSANASDCNLRTFVIRVTCMNTSGCAGGINKQYNISDPAKNSIAALVTSNLQKTTNGVSFSVAQASYGVFVDYAFNIKFGANGTYKATGVGALSSGSFSRVTSGDFAINCQQPPTPPTTPKNNYTFSLQASDTAKCSEKKFTITARCLSTTGCMGGKLEYALNPDFTGLVTFIDNVGKSGTIMSLRLPTSYNGTSQISFTVRLANRNYAVGQLGNISLYSIVGNEFVEEGVIEEETVAEEMAEEETPAEEANGGFTSIYPSSLAINCQQPPTPPTTPKNNYTFSLQASDTAKCSEKRFTITARCLSTTGCTGGKLEYALNPDFTGLVTFVDNFGKTGSIISLGLPKLYGQTTQVSFIVRFNRNGTYAIGKDFGTISLYTLIGNETAEEGIVEEKEMSEEMAEEETAEEENNGGFASVYPSSFAINCQQPPTPPTTPGSIIVTTNVDTNTGNCTAKVTHTIACQPSGTTCNGINDNGLVFNYQLYGSRGIKFLSSSDASVKAKIVGLDEIISKNIGNLSGGSAVKVSYNISCKSEPCKQSVGPITYSVGNSVIGMIAGQPQWMGDDNGVSFNGCKSYYACYGACALVIRDEDFASCERTNKTTTGEECFTSLATCKCAVPPDGRMHFSKCNTQVNCNDKTELAGVDITCDVSAMGRYTTQSANVVAKLFNAAGRELASSKATAISANPAQYRATFDNLAVNTKYLYEVDANNEGGISWNFTTPINCKMGGECQVASGMNLSTNCKVPLGSEATGRCVKVLMKFVPFNGKPIFGQNVTMNAAYSRDGQTIRTTASAVWNTNTQTPGYAITLTGINVASGGAINVTLPEYTILTPATLWANNPFRFNYGKYATQIFTSDTGRTVVGGTSFTSLDLNIKHCCGNGICDSAKGETSLNCSVDCKGQKYTIKAWMTDVECQDAKTGKYKVNIKAQIFDQTGKVVQDAWPEFSVGPAKFQGIEHPSASNGYVSTLIGLINDDPAALIPVSYADAKTIVEPSAEAKACKGGDCIGDFGNEALRVETIAPATCINGKLTLTGRVLAASGKIKRAWFNVDGMAGRAMEPLYVSEMPTKDNPEFTYIGDCSKLIEGNLYFVTAAVEDCKTMVSKGGIQFVPKREKASVKLSFINQSIVKTVNGSGQPDSAEGNITFSVTANGGDVYLPMRVSPEYASAHLFSVQTSNGEKHPKYDVAFGCTADIVGNDYIIREGETKSCMASFAFTSFKDAYYFASIDRISWKSEAAGALIKESSVKSSLGTFPLNSEFKTSAIFLRFGSQVTTGKIVRADVMVYGKENCGQSLEVKLTCSPKAATCVNTAVKLALNKDVVDIGGLGNTIEPANMLGQFFPIENDVVMFTLNNFTNETTVKFPVTVKKNSGQILIPGKSSAYVYSVPGQNDSVQIIGATNFNAQGCEKIEPACAQEGQVATISRPCCEGLTYDPKSLTCVKTLVEECAKEGEQPSFIKPCCTGLAKDRSGVCVDMCKDGNSLNAWQRVDGYKQSYRCYKGGIYHLEYNPICKKYAVSVLGRPGYVDKVAYNTENEADSVAKENIAAWVAQEKLNDCQCYNNVAIIYLGRLSASGAKMTLYSASFSSKFNPPLAGTKIYDYEANTIEAAKQAIDTDSRFEHNQCADGGIVEPSCQCKSGCDQVCGKVLSSAGSYDYQTFDDKCQMEAAKYILSNEGPCLEAGGLRVIIKSATSGEGGSKMQAQVIGAKAGTAASYKPQFILYPCDNKAIAIEMGRAGTKVDSKGIYSFNPDYLFLKNSGFCVGARIYVNGKPVDSANPIPFK